MLPLLLPVSLLRVHAVVAPPHLYDLSDRGGFGSYNKKDHVSEPNSLVQKEKTPTSRVRCLWAPLGVWVVAMLKVLPHLLPPLGEGDAVPVGLAIVLSREEALSEGRCWYATHLDVGDGLQLARGGGLGVLLGQRVGEVVAVGEAWMGGLTHL